MGLFTKKTTAEAATVRRELKKLAESEERARRSTSGLSAKDRRGFQQQREQLTDQLDWAEQRGRYKNS